MCGKSKAMLRDCEVRIKIGYIDEHVTIHKGDWRLEYRPGLPDTEKTEDEMKRSRQSVLDYLAGFEAMELAELIISWVENGEEA